MLATAGLVALFTAIFGVIGNLFLSQALEGIMHMFSWLGGCTDIDFTLINDLQLYVISIVSSFMVVKTGFTVLNNYIMKMTDNRLAYRDPTGIILGIFKAIIAIILIPFYVKGVWMISGLLVGVIGNIPSFEADTLKHIGDFTIIGTIPLLIMVLVFLIAFAVVGIQFCLRMAEFIFSIISGYVFAVGLINDQASSPAFNNWFTKVLGLGFVNAAQMLCINLSARSLNGVFEDGILSGQAFPYFMLSVGFIVLCASTPATIKQIAHSTGLSKGISGGVNMVRTISYMKK